MRHQRELEFKVQLSKAEIARLTRKLPSKDMIVSRPSRKRLRSIYFDTSQQSLHAAGISLRLRRGRNRWIQTVKTDLNINSGLSNPVELETTVEGAEPDLDVIDDPALSRRLRKAVGKAPLHRVFETIVQRTTRQVKVGGSEIELALDEGEVRSGKMRRGLCEAELELKRGSVEGLLVAAQHIFAGRQLKFSTQSKSSQGYELAGAKKSGTAPQKRPQDQIMAPQSKCSEVFYALLESASRQIVDNRQLMLETDDPKAPHQLRIGLRRLRSVLRALRPLVDSPSLRKFDDVASDLARQIGKLRDADVLIGAIYAPVEKIAPEKQGFAQLHEALLQHRKARQEEVRTALNGTRWSDLQLYLTLWPRTLEEARVLKQPISSYARRVLQRRWKKVRKLGRKLDQLGPEARHDMRKSLKHLRYLAEFFSPVFARGKTRRFIERLKVLQDVFGYMNDVHMARKLRTIQKQYASPEARSSVDYILGWHDAAAREVWRRANRSWKRLEGSPSFWS
jgi:triphosphatase